MRIVRAVVLATVAILALSSAAHGGETMSTPESTPDKSGCHTSRWEGVCQDILKRMVDAINTRDLDAFVDCFAEDVVSNTPIHPSRSFVGRENVRRNWSMIFANVPDIHATVLQSTRDGHQVWSEWEIEGNTVTGEQYLTRGVAILRMHRNEIAFVQFYLDPVDSDS